MDKKEVTDSKPVGICEKLFSALPFSTGFRPLHRISAPPQPTATTEPSPPPPLSTCAVSEPLKTHTPEKSNISITEVAPTKAKTTPPSAPLPQPTLDKPNPVPSPPPIDVTKSTHTNTKPVPPLAPPPPSTLEKPKPITGPPHNYVTDLGPSKPPPTLEKPKPITTPPLNQVNELATTKPKPMPPSLPPPPPPTSAKEKEKTTVPPPTTYTQGKGQLVKINSKVESAQEKEKLGNKVLSAPPLAALAPAPAPAPPAPARDINDDTENFITRAKIKIRSMTGLGGGKAST